MYDTRYASETDMRAPGESYHTLDGREIFLRFFKYIFEGLVIATVAYFSRKLDAEEIMILALTAASVFAMLDFFIPAMGASVRTGAGWGIGMNLVGFPGNVPLR